MVVVVVWGLLHPTVSKLLLSPTHHRFSKTNTNTNLCKIITNRDTHHIIEPQYIKNPLLLFTHPLTSTTFLISVISAAQ